MASLRSSVTDFLARPNLRAIPPQVWRFALVAVLLLGAALLGLHPSRRYLLLLGGLMGLVLLLWEPRLGVLAVVVAALVVPIELKTGTEVTLDAATLLVPAMAALIVLRSVPEERKLVRSSRPHLPLVLFLAAGLLLLLMGNVLWDPEIVRTSGFTLVQLAQWSIFAFSALAYWLGVGLARDPVWLRRLTWLFLRLGGGLAILRIVPGGARIVGAIGTIAFIRAPFWMLLTAVSAGLLLYDRTLRRSVRLFLVLVLASTLIYAYVAQQEAASNWIAIAAALAILIWLRFPKLRWVASVLLVILVASNVLFPSLYEFAGGEDEWLLSGGSRLALIDRVVNVTMRNPIMGLGPASYRLYANAEPLRYRNTVWFNPQVNSHNNYVDLFAHTGLVGLGLFVWFAVELILLGVRLSRRHRQGFLGGYVNAMVAAWVGALVLMMMADWILPFVYNIGFPGFQASLLVWLFLGGLVGIERLDDEHGTAA